MPEDDLTLSADPGTVTIDLEPKPPLKEEPKPQDLTEILSEVKHVRELNESLSRQVKASYRVTERLQRELDDLRRGISPPKQQSTPLPAPVLDDESQRVAELKPWETPLRKIMREEAEILLKNRDEKLWLEQNERNRQEESSRSQQFVLEKYPDLAIDDSELTGTYLSVVNAHPEWNRDPFGPGRAMLEMEKVAKDQGISLKSSSPALSPKLNTEVVRRARANATSLPPSRGGTQPTKVTLSKDQEDFAKSHRIPVETYAKMVAAQNNGSIEVQ